MNINNIPRRPKRTRPHYGSTDVDLSGLQAPAAQPMTTQIVTPQPTQQSAPIQQMPQSQMPQEPNTEAQYIVSLPAAIIEPSGSGSQHAY